VDVSVQDSGHSIFGDDIGIYSQRQSYSFPSPDVLPELRRNNLLLYCCIYRSYYWDITNGTVSPTLVLYPSTSNDSSSTTLAIAGFIIKDVCMSITILNFGYMLTSLKKMRRGATSFLTF
jgi:hypothetical protein